MSTSTPCSGKAELELILVRLSMLFFCCVRALLWGAQEPCLMALRALWHTIRSCGFSGVFQHPSCSPWAAGTCALEPRTPPANWRVLRAFWFRRPVVAQCVSMCAIRSVLGVRLQGADRGALAQGPMFSGKTTELFRRIKRYTAGGT
jgi:hypothetical protein